MIRIGGASIPYWSSKVGIRGTFIGVEELGPIVVDWAFIVEDARRLGIPITDFIRDLEQDPEILIVGKPE